MAESLWRATPSRCSTAACAARHDHKLGTAPATSDPLLAGLGPHWVTPHSRSNALDEAELAGSGYTVLARSREAGLDSFIRRGSGGATMLFLQGHPEYEPGSLALEFKRDLQHYLEGVRDTLPALPQGVFGGTTSQRVERLLHQARRDRRAELMHRWPPASQIALAADTWSAPAARLCRNWLTSAEKASAAVRASELCFAMPRDGERAGR